MSEESAGKKVVDWEAVEREYRLGVRSLREIGQAYGVSESGIRKRAGRDGWDRDLSARVAAKAETLVRKASVRSEVRSTQKDAERALVEASAEALKDVLLGHRIDIRQARGLATSLLDELRAMTNTPELFEKLCVLVSSEAGDGQSVMKRADAFAKVLDHPSRVDSLRKLGDTLKTLIGLERQAFGLKDGEADRPPGDGGGSPAMSSVERDALREFLAARAPAA